MANGTTLRQLACHLCLFVFIWLAASLNHSANAVDQQVVPAPSSTITDERAKAAAQLEETQRLRQAELPSGSTTSNLLTLRFQDRQRLLDRLLFLQSERIKHLDELALLQSSTPSGIHDLAVVQALGDTPPYSALAVDALRDAQDGLIENLRGIDTGLATRELEKQNLLDQLRQTEENERLAKDRLATEKASSEKDSVLWEQEQARLRKMLAEAELAVLDIDVEKYKFQRKEVNQRISEMRNLISRVLPLQRLSENDIATLKSRMADQQSKLAKEIADAQARQRKHQSERQRLSIAPLEPKVAGRILLLDHALKTDSVILEGLHGLEMLIAVNSDAWQKRYVLLSIENHEERRRALASLEKLYQRLVSRKNLSKAQQDGYLLAIRDQENRLLNTPSSLEIQRQEKEVLALLRERLRIHERQELAADRLERQLARWQADFKTGQHDGLQSRILPAREDLHRLFLAFWDYELFAVEDTSELDGRKVVVSYGVTVGKSIGALMIFILGYWIFSHLARWLQLLLVRRFGINDQLASVIRRWLMIVLAVGLVIFILNLARIPLTVFAFMGGALAIGLGFGTQTIIKNFISGIIILFERKIRVGDIIELSGVTGHVTAVDLRATTVRGFDGVEALVPNSNFLENQVVNWTYSNPQIRRELRIGVAYGSNSRQTETLLIQAAVDHPKILKMPAPEVYFEDFADNALLMILIYWVELGTGTVARRVDSDVRHVIYERLVEAGISIPFPQRDVHIDLLEPLHVRLADRENT
jgi:small-conductance mechanosensitive channel